MVTGQQKERSWEHGRTKLRHQVKWEDYSYSYRHVYNEGAWEMEQPMVSSPSIPLSLAWCEMRKIPQYLLCQLCNCVKRGRQLATPSPHQPHSDPNHERYVIALPPNTDLLLNLCVWACRVLTLLQTCRACMEVGSQTASLVTQHILLSQYWQHVEEPWSGGVGATGHRGVQLCYWCRRNTCLYKCIINSVYELLKTESEHMKNKCN